MLDEKDKALTLIYKGEEKTSITTQVKEGFAVAEVKLQHCKIDEDNEDWVKLLFPDTVKKIEDLKQTELYIKVVSTENVFTVVNKGVFLKNDTFKLTSYTCGCQKCVNYQDVVPNPEINNQVKKNNNRYHKAKRTRIKSDGTTYQYYHNGTDIIAAIGTDIHSLLCGKVIHIRTNLPQDHTKPRNKQEGYESSSSYGNTILIESYDTNGRKIYIFYAHCSSVSVKKGDFVIHGQIIGKSGSTGNAMRIARKNDHCHVEAGTAYILYANNLKSKLTTRINPETYMKTKFDENGNTI